MLKVTHPQASAAAIFHLYSGTTVCAVSSTVEILIPEIENRINNYNSPWPQYRDMRSLHKLTEDHCISALIYHARFFPKKLSSLDQDQNTPLHIAAGHGHVEAVRILARNAKTLSMKNKNGDTALCFAVCYPNSGQKEVIKLLASISPCLDQLISAHQKAIQLAQNKTISCLQDFIACRMFGIALFQAHEPPIGLSPLQQFVSNVMFEPKVLKLVKQFLIGSSVSLYPRLCV